METKTVQTRRPGASVRKRRFTAVVLAAGAFGVCAYSMKQEMRISKGIEITGTAASCRHREVCDVLAKAGDTIWRASIAGGEYETSIRVARVDERGVVFKKIVSGVKGERSELFRVNFDGGAENRPWRLEGMRAERTPDKTTAKITID